MKGKVACKPVDAIEGIVYNNEKNDKLVYENKHYILVAEETNPDMLDLIINAKAVITEIGGILSHAAIVSREFNIPCIVGIPDVTSNLNSGDYILMNLNLGEVFIKEDTD